MANTLKKALGFVASGCGLIPYSTETVDFMTSGYKCKNCGKRGIFGAGLKAYSKNGEQLRYWRIWPLIPYYLECEHCHHRWAALRSAEAPEDTSLSLGIQDIRITETSREAEPIGEDQKIIDNSKSSITLTRRFQVTKEWSQTCVLETNEITATTSTFGIGTVEGISFQRLAEARLSERYSVQENKRLVYTEDIVLNIPPNTKLRVVFQWKRIWQRGLLALAFNNGQIVTAQFRVVIAVTFDQVQLDEP
jgi:hypothetical protein